MKRFIHIVWEIDMYGAGANKDQLIGKHKNHVLMTSFYHNNSISLWFAKRKITRLMKIIV